MRLGLLTIAACLLCACDQSTVGPETERTESSPTSALDETDSGYAFSIVQSFDTDGPVSGISIVPARGHRGEAMLAVAREQAGVAVYDLKGRMIWSDEKPADLAVYSEGKLLVYRKGEDADSVDVYTRSGRSLFEFEVRRSPPIPAATTLQRTALAAIGPVRIEGNEIDLVNYGRLRAKAKVTAVAGASALIPLSNSAVITYADENGLVYIARVEAVKAQS